MAFEGKWCNYMKDDGGGCEGKAFKALFVKLFLTEANYEIVSLIDDCDSIREPP
jgi:hypothetical protein